MWACPHCQLALLPIGTGESLACANRHAFDRAREGYVNLLPANRKRSLEPGDNPLMVAARRRVHEADIYRPLADALVTELAGLSGVSSLLDLGCGEAYYCDALARALPDCTLCGIDISRAAIRLAARRCRSVDFAVASAYRLPLLDEALDAIVRVFAPADDAEIVRALKPGRYYLEVSPAPRHLWQVRALLYDKPREHAPPRMAAPGLRLLGQAGVQYEASPGPELVWDIISMTPFAYRGRPERREYLQRHTPAAVTMAFSLHLYCRDA
ncbi:MAG: methyltransferase domain-containing protein [Halioglobus sp.]|nr:methyltransferase domain-containing protein [Halioglobus sp.]